MDIPRRMSADGHDLTIPIGPHEIKALEVFFERANP